MVDLIVLAMYLLGMMELPPYHRPLFKGLMIHLWDKLKHFVKKAFTIILASTIVIWFLSHFSWDWHYLADEQMADSILASIGKLIQPIFTPLGFGSQLGRTAGWVFAVAAITGLVAKENVIATFSVLCATIASGLGFGFEATEEGVNEVMFLMGQTGITIPALISFIAFNMLTIPCFAACATARAELPKGKFKWTLLFWIATSYFVSAAIYLIGSWWWTLFPILAVVAAGITGIVFWNRKHPLKKNEAPMSEGDALEEAAISSDDKENKL